MTVSHTNDFDGSENKLVCFFVAELSSADESIFLKILTDLSSENVKKDKNILQAPRVKNGKKKILDTGNWMHICHFVFYAELISMSIILSTVSTKYFKICEIQLLKSLEICFW